MRQEIMTDWGRIFSTPVQSVVRPADEGQLSEVVRRSAAAGARITIRGAGHSAGGHSFRHDAVVIDMRLMNQVVHIDRESGLIRVQGGATWADITPLCESLGLGIATKQEFDIFTVGGSVAANVHGKSVDYGPLIESIRSLRLCKADGSIVNVSREENSDLFPAVVGGYGLLGVVVDVSFELVPDRPVARTEVVRDELKPLCSSYIGRLLERGSRPPLCYGFLDSTCRKGFFLTYSYADGASGDLKRDEPSQLVFNTFVGLSRHVKFLRDRSFQLMWAASRKSESPTLRSRRLLLWDTAPHAFDGMWLQKYFIPLERFADFAAAAGRIFARYADLPLLTNHFRFVPGNAEAILSFAPRDAICMIPCYLARKGDPRWSARFSAISSELIEAALAQEGSYYLTFDAFAAPDQLRRAYPDFERFLAVKHRHDPGQVFSSTFYERAFGVTGGGPERSGMGEEAFAPPVAGHS